MPQQKRYPARTPFAGVIGRTLATSTPAWPAGTIAPSGSPNVLAMDVHLAASRDRWPLGQGFERYYGFLGGATDQYYPELTDDNHKTNPLRDSCCDRDLY